MHGVKNTTVNSAHIRQRKITEPLCGETFKFPEFKIVKSEPREFHQDQKYSILNAIKEYSSKMDSCADTVDGSLDHKKHTVEGLDPTA